MRSRPVLLPLALAAACAGPAGPAWERAPVSPAVAAVPEPDPSLRGTPMGYRGLRPIEQVAVRVRRVPDGGVTIVEFLSPGLSEQEQAGLRLDFAAGRLRLGGEGAPGEQTWTTTLHPSSGAR